MFFCESAFDAMAFHQMNRSRLHPDVALVSLGGTFSDNQITGVIERFPNAKAFDCFDNDIAGRIYGLRMIGLLEGIPMRISKAEDGLQVEAGGKTFTVHPGKPAFASTTCRTPSRPLPYRAMAAAQGVQGLERLPAEQAGGYGPRPVQGGTRPESGGAEKGKP